MLCLHDLISVGDTGIEPVTFPRAGHSNQLSIKTK